MSLSLTLLLTTVRLLPVTLEIPSDSLPLMTQFLTVKMPILAIPTSPFLMVRPEIIAIAETEKTFHWGLPSIESWLAPGPEIVTFLVTRSPPLVSAMVPVTAKLIVSPSFAYGERLPQRAGSAVVCVGDRDDVGRSVSLSRGSLCERERDHANSQK